MNAPENPAEPNVEDLANGSERLGFDALAGLELTAEILASFKQDGISIPTTVQRLAIPPLLAGKNLVIASGTGTGKTLAYALPVLQRLRESSEGRALCITPATELAVQIYRTIERYRDPALKVGALVASGNAKKQRADIQKSTRFIVGTTGRVLEMYAERKLKGVTTVILDEPEPILSSRGADFLREVLSRPEPKVQLILAGATMGRHSEALIAQLMGPDALRTQVDESPLHTLITHYFVPVRDPSQKDLAVARFLQNNRCKQAILFVNQANLIRHVYRFLSESGARPVTVSQERSKADCKQAINDFAAGTANVLITTDQAATGLDMADVGWVLHYELPTSGSAYVHRAGRTGRAGKSGCSVVFANETERPLLMRVGRELSIAFEAFPR